MNSNAAVTYTEIKLLLCNKPHVLHNNCAILFIMTALFCNNIL